MAVWMLAAVAISCLISATACLVDRVASGRVPHRLIWGATMCASILVPLLLTASASSSFVVDGTPGRGSLSRVFAEPVGLHVVVAQGRLWRLNRWLVVLWAGMTLLVAVRAAAAVVSGVRARRNCVRTRVDDVDVLVSVDVGPAVVGFRIPVILLPRWLLDWEAEARDMVVHHEKEHLIAHDQIVLLTAVVLLALQPWNPLLWWQHSRLRLAIELDCDRRVLRARFARGAYCEALLSVARSSPPSAWVFTTGTPAAGALERRVRAVVETGHRLRRAPAMALLSLAALLAVVAAVVPVPPFPLPGVARRVPDISVNLPGEPRPEQLLDLLNTHHPVALRDGLPEGAIVWAVADASGGVRDTGVEFDLTESELRRLLRAKYGDLAAYGVSTEVQSSAGSVAVTWLFPAPDLQ